MRDAHGTDVRPEASLVTRGVRNRSAHDAPDEVLRRVLDHFALPKLSDAVPNDVLTRFGLVRPTQYGVACRDVKRACAEAERLGAGPFVVATIDAVGWRERGVRVPGCRLDVGLGFVGNTQIEFLGPGRRTRFYSDALDGADARLHHAGIYQRGVESLGAHLVAAGHPEAVRGGLHLGAALSFDFRYYDTRDALGIYLEVLDFRVLDRPLIMDPFIRVGARIAALGRPARSTG
ncbi:MAG: hypothetical protein KC668_02670 [Myxococcales bacterium]|nr:hypothetical protein [Myxococcales bacterium]